jgi:uncharacterized protein (TIGR03067 family)
MRRTKFAALAILCAASVWAADNQGEKGKEAKTDMEKLQGTWVVVSADAGVEEAEKNLKDVKNEAEKHEIKAVIDSLKRDLDEMKGAKFIFNKSKLNTKTKDGKDGKDVKGPLSVANGTYELKSMKSPKEIDVTWMSPKGPFVFKGIYLLEGETLKIVFNTESKKDTESEQPKGFKGGGNGYSQTMFILKRTGSE